MDIDSWASQALNFWLEKIREAVAHEYALRTLALWDRP